MILFGKLVVTIKGDQGAGLCQTLEMAVHGFIRLLQYICCHSDFLSLFK